VVAQSSRGEAKRTIRVAAVGDLHCKVESRGLFQPLLAKVAESADVLVLCGDLTDHGLNEEAKVLAGELAGSGKLPTVAVLGNHDYESGQQGEVRQILRDAGVSLLDGDAIDVKGVGFAGVKGFAGGFGRGTLSAFGEPVVKEFVREALEEAMKLEAALLRLRTPGKIAILHYSPIRGTVENEPLEIYPFLGCSRLEEPINRYQVNACVHGHAHNGSPEGKTAGGVPVFNVSLPLMRKIYPDRPAFRLMEVDVASAGAPGGDGVQNPAAGAAGTGNQAPVETRL
jgi:Icc-related predicted phosphoesterase